MGNPFKFVKDLPPDDFIEQFGKDLANSDVTNLEQLKWIFDGKKVPADFKSKMIEEIKKIPLTDDIARKMLIQDKQELFENIVKNFDNIFIIGK